jgi:hypothetical protein
MPHDLGYQPIALDQADGSAPPGFIGKDVYVRALIVRLREALAAVIELVKAQSFRL